MKTTSPDGVEILLAALRIEKKDLTAQQYKNIEDFVIVTIECDQEIRDGIDRQIPMTRELYQRTVARLERLGAERTLEDFIDCFGADFRNC